MPKTTEPDLEGWKDSARQFCFGGVGALGLCQQGGGPGKGKGEGTWVPPYPCPGPQDVWEAPPTLRPLGSDSVTLLDCDLCHLPFLGLSFSDCQMEG